MSPKSNPCPPFCCKPLSPNWSPNWYPVCRAFPLQPTCTQQWAVSLPCSHPRWSGLCWPSDLNFLLQSCWHSCCPFASQGLDTCCSWAGNAFKVSLSLYAGLCSNIKIWEVFSRAVSLTNGHNLPDLTSLLLFLIAFADVLLYMTVTLISSSYNIHSLQSRVLLTLTMHLQCLEQHLEHRRHSTA